MRIFAMMRRVLLAGWLASAATAENAPPFPELMREAEQSAPLLAEAAANVSAAQGRARQASVWLNPQVSVELEDFAGSGAYSGSSRAQTTIAVSEPLELGGQRAARIAVGRAELTAAQAQRLQTRASFGYELAVAYATAEAAQQRVELLTEDLNRSREDLRSARALVQNGKEGELRAMQAEAAVSTAVAELEGAHADVVGGLARLSSLVGVTEPYTGVTPSLLIASTRADAPPKIDAPIVVTAQAQREAAERRVAIERKRIIPTPSLSVGTRRIAGDDANVWVAGISLPLPVFDRNRGGIDAAQAELRAADARLTATRLNAEAEWRTATTQAAAARSRLAASDQAEASAREAYRLARIGYDAGRSPLFELQSTRRALIEAQLRSLDVRLARVRADAALARLSGVMPFTE